MCDPVFEPSSVRHLTGYDQAVYAGLVDYGQILHSADGGAFRYTLVLLVHMVGNRHAAVFIAENSCDILWLPVFSRPQAKRCLYAVIQLSRCRGILICPFTIYGVSEAFFHPLLTEDANHSLICPKYRAETRLVLGVLSNPSGTIRKVQYTLS